MRHIGTNVEVADSYEATIVEVEYFLSKWDRSGRPAGREIITGIGTAKREREDDYDPEIGEALAAARAFEELAARLNRRARRLIHAQESERKARATRRTKEEWEALQEQAQGLADNVSAAYNYMKNVYEGAGISQGLWQNLDSPKLSGQDGMFRVELSEGRSLVFEDGFVVLVSPDGSHTRLTRN